MDVEAIKKRIDEYFDNITPDELLRKAVYEFGFYLLEEADTEDCVNQEFYD